MASFTSESDSNTIIAGEEQRDLSYYFFSLTNDINRASKNPQVPTAPDSVSDYGVRVLFFCFWLSVNPLWSSGSGNGYSEGRKPTANVGVHSEYFILGGKASSISVISVITEHPQTSNASLACGFPTLFTLYFKNYLYTIVNFFVRFSDGRLGRAR